MKPYPTTPKGLNGASSSSWSARKPNKPLSVALNSSSSVLIVASMDRCDDATPATIARLRPAGETGARAANGQDMAVPPSSVMRLPALHQSNCIRCQEPEAHWQQCTFVV